MAVAQWPPRAPLSYADESDRIAEARQAIELARLANNTAVLFRYLASAHEPTGKPGDDQMTALFAKAHDFLDRIRAIDSDQRTSSEQTRPIEYALPYNRLVPVKVWRKLVLEPADSESMATLISDLPTLVQRAKAGEATAVELTEYAQQLEATSQRLLVIAAQRSV